MCNKSTTIHNKSKQMEFELNAWHENHVTAVNVVFRSCLDIRQRPAHSPEMLRVLSNARYYHRCFDLVSSSITFIAYSILPAILYCIIIVQSWFKTLSRRLQAIIRGLLDRINFEQVFTVRQNMLSLFANGMHFYRATQLCYRGVGSRNSVCLSICLSVRHRRVLWQNQTIHCRYFDTTRNGNHSSFLTPTVIGGRRPLLSEICAQIDPPPSKNADFDRFRLYIVSAVTDRPSEKQFNYNG